MARKGWNCSWEREKNTYGAPSICKEARFLPFSNVAGEGSLFGASLEHTEKDGREKEEREVSALG